MKNGSFIDQISLKDDNNESIVESKLFSNSGNYKSCSINDNEIIFGLYGVKDKQDWISSLGFIVLNTSGFNWLLNYC